MIISKNSVAKLLLSKTTLSFLFFIALLPSLFGQEINNHIYTEAEIVFDNGIKKSKLITVKFNNNVIPLLPGKRAATVAQISTSFPKVISFFAKLRQQYGKITFHKKIPSAEWGDVWRTHKWTGEQVKINDWSQLFAVRFKKLVPIDDVINDLEKLKDVEYAYQPIRAISFAEVPDDPCYDEASDCVPNPPNDDQWNLKIIDAEDAWGITKGNTSIKVGIIDNGHFNRDHNDLDSKFTSDGDPESTSGGNQHGTQIAGVVGAETDNNTGIASLGWNVKIAPYHFSENIYTDSTDSRSLEYEIDRARTQGMDVISFSFGMFKRHPIAEDCNVPASFPGVSGAIEDAINVGIIVIAATGIETRI